MRSDLSLDRNSWDLVITDDIGIVENAAMTSQDSKFSLQLIQGEVFDDNRLGMPWLTDMVNPQVSIAAKKQILRDTIMRTPGAVELTSLDVAVDNQTGIASCTFEGVTDNGGIFGSSVGDIDIPSVTDSGIIAEYDYITGKSFGLRLERSSEATYIKDGLLKYAGINIPRFENDGLLLEPGTANLLRYSSDLNNSQWPVIRSSKSAGYPSPDGGSSAIHFSADSTLNTHYIGQGFSKDNDTTYTLSIFLKASEQSRVAFQAGGFAQQIGGQTARVYLDSGEIIGPVDQSRVSIVNVGNGFFRASTVIMTNSTPGNITPQVFSVDQSKFSTTHSGDGVSGFLMWGCQIEVGSTATSFIPTSGDIKSRSADVISVIKDSAKWIYREYVPLGLVSTVKELVEYDGTISPYGHLQKLKVWDREPTSSERAALGL